MKRKVLTLTFLLFTALVPVKFVAAKQITHRSISISLKPEALSAKALLEDLVARRYSRELATQVDREEFRLGAQLELAEMPRAVNAPQKVEKQNTQSDVPSDFLLGTLDPEKLIESYAGQTAEKTEIQGFLSNYRIRSVAVSVGLHEDLGAGVKSQVETWLRKRVHSEFGRVGTSAVTFIRMPPVKTAPVPKPEPKTRWDRLAEFQGLAGQIVLAFAILLGTLLWALFGSRGKDRSDRKEIVATPAPSQVQPLRPTESKADLTVSEGDERKTALLTQEQRQLTRKLTGLAPKLAGDIERIMRSWCQGGEDGKLKLACFVEAVGTEMGRLPIPADALRDLSRVFAKMPELGLEEKLDKLRKAYWDLLMAVNLGSDSLAQPFSYLGGLNVRMVNQMLMGQNPKMRALVALHMPTELRQSYLHELQPEQKRELVQTIARLNEVAVEELNTFDGMLRKKVQPSGSKDVITLDSALKLIVSAMSPVDEVEILAGMEGDALEELKRGTPSLAFLGEWPDGPLSLLLSRALPDEVVAYLRLRPEMADRVLGLCPEMTSEVASDELSREDSLSLKDKNRLLGEFTERLKEMVASHEIDLLEVFDEVTEGQKMKAGETQYDLKKSA